MLVYAIVIVILVVFLDGFFVRFLLACFAMATWFVDLYLLFASLVGQLSMAPL